MYYGFSWNWIMEIQFNFQMFIIIIITSRYQILLPGNACSLLRIGNSMAVGNIDHTSSCWNEDWIRDIEDLSDIPKHTRPRDKQWKRAPDSEWPAGPVDLKRTPEDLRWSCREKMIGPHQRLQHSMTTTSAKSILSAFYLYLKPNLIRIPSLIVIVHLE